MKVKELKEWLEQFDDNDIVGGIDIGQDSGDWIEYNFPEEVNIRRDLIIKRSFTGCGKWFKSFESGRIGIDTQCGYQYRRNTKK